MFRHTVTFLLFLTCFHFGKGLCYFPALYQGEYLTQASGTPFISYSRISISFDSISVWGLCYRRLGNNVLLREESGEITCFKCFNLNLRSSNVLQIHSSGLDKCYTSEERALYNCPSEESIRNRNSKEIMLYRTKGILGETSVSPSYCPINGAYTFSYSLNDGSDVSLECSSFNSRISDCPYSFGFNLHLSDCSFGSMDMAFHCLGDWDYHLPGTRVLALMDTHASSQDSSDTRPRYRCAMYSKDEKTQQIHFALSSDSTCINDLTSSHQGYESLILNPIPKAPWSSSAISPNCIFPDFTLGNWEHVSVKQETLILKDTKTFKTLEASCVSDIQSSRFLLYSRTTCGEESYKCIWFQNRGENALEFQIGASSSQFFNESLCSDANFPSQSWITQGRLHVETLTSYPILGEYTGVIPDTDGLCAKLYSDCNNPEIMFYTIFNCFNRSDVFEEREYRCLGSWKENELVYTYTERRDIIGGGYECFVAYIGEREKLYLREAGINCERFEGPKKSGMKLSQSSKCYSENSPKVKWRFETSTLGKQRVREKDVFSQSSSSSLIFLHYTLIYLCICILL